MTDKSLLGELSVKALIELVSSNEIAPGAGAVGAVTLALASACAAKAVSISLKHSPDDPRLMTALPRLETLRRLALHEADIDSNTFKDFVRGRTAKAATDLVEAGESLGHLIDSLISIIGEVEPSTNSSMKGDLLAAKSLATAVRTIQIANEEETKVGQRNIAERKKIRASTGAE